MKTLAKSKSVTQSPPTEGVAPTGALPHAAPVGRQWSPPVFERPKRARFEVCRFATVRLAERRFRNGRVNFALQCIDCGKRATDWLKHDDQRVTWNLHEAVAWVERGVCPTFEAEHEAARKEHQDFWWRWYSVYLASQEWRWKRDEVLARAGGLCEVDGCGLKAEQVHHTTYERVGNEDLEDLLALCSSCHEQIHALLDERRAGRQP